MSSLIWLGWVERLTAELIQCELEDRYITPYLADCKLAIVENDEVKAQALYQIINSINSDNRQEPLSYEGILKQSSVVSKLHYDKLSYQEKLKGAYFGRAIGCLLGIPVEGWPKLKITNYLKDSKQWPLIDYIAYDDNEALVEKYQLSLDDPIDAYDRGFIYWKQRIKNFPVDDDTNYLVMNFKIVETYGRDFTMANIGEIWSTSLPFTHACTAERVAFDNLNSGMEVTNCGRLNNPYREFIGAQIRADFWGYINPGGAMEAARMAYIDGSFTHTKNGVYGEMLISAILSLAVCDLNMVEIVTDALKLIPCKSRLYKEVSKILTFYYDGIEFKKVIKYIHQKYQEDLFFDWCYINPNAMIVIACILNYSDDFSEAITQAVLAGFDTDCNGATVGSILGMYLGFNKIDAKWYRDIEPVIESSVSGFSRISIDDLVDRTMKFVS